MNNNLQKYTNYKPSGVEWLGEIPEHWEVKKLKYLLNGKLKYGANESGIEYDISLPRYVRITDFGFNGKLSETNKLSLSWQQGGNYLLKDGDILFARSGATVGKTYQFKKSMSIESNYCYAGYLIKAETDEKKILSDFLYLYTNSDFFNRWKDSIFIKATIENIGADKYSQLIIPIPPLTEQTRIAEFLDRKTAQIDQAITIKEKQIALLKERRQILIHRAVTRGINPDVKLKPSGVEWIGDIPEHWEVKKLKYILIERNERSVAGDEPLLMMSQIHGLVVRSDFHEKAEVAQSSVGNKLVYKEDLVFNKLKAHLGVFFKSSIPQTGIVSPDYAVYYSNGKIKDLKFLEVLFKSPSYIREFICRATGIVEGLIRLYTGDLFDISVPVPPKSEQSLILEHIENISEKIATAITLKEQEIEKLKEYKSTLINSAVTGKIRV
ncbi:MAG: restriction endonuclease subunit S [Arcicella sp.]|jgi:type I restriction enzyme S subunit|nr:restriction endonuclease subunit S [Arcicella sp.]